MPFVPAVSATMKEERPGAKLLDTFAADLKAGMYNTALPPSVYGRVQENLSLSPAGADVECQGPEPYEGDLDFRSRYEGDDGAHDQINEEAEREYLEETQLLKDLQQFLASKTDAIIKGAADQQTLACVLQTLRMWAADSDLLIHTDDYTGRAVRKWTLAAIASSLLKIDHMAEQYDSESFPTIKDWVAQLAEQVVTDYSGFTLDKINNHCYWAAWAVMTSAALLDRKDLFVWSSQMYSTAMGQVNDDGFLPNELRRETRAAQYHNYALTPLVGVAAFLEANNVDPFQLNNNALLRLSNVVIDSIDSLDAIEIAAGVTQEPYDFFINGRLAWLAIYTFLGISSSQERTLRVEGLCNDLSPLRLSRLGGDVGFVYQIVA